MKFLTLCPRCCWVRGGAKHWFGTGVKCEDCGTPQVHRALPVKADELFVRGPSVLDEIARCPSIEQLRAIRLRLGVDTDPDLDLAHGLPAAKRTKRRWYRAAISRERDLTTGLVLPASA